MKRTSDRSCGGGVSRGTVSNPPTDTAECLHDIVSRRLTHHSTVSHANHIHTRTHTRFRKKTLLFVGALLSLICVSNAATFVNELPLLPQNFESPKYVNSNGDTELHLHGVFALAPAPARNHVLTFSVKAPSVMRVAASMIGASTISVLVYDTLTMSHVFDCPKSDRHCFLFGPVIPVPAPAGSTPAPSPSGDTEPTPATSQADSPQPTEYEFVILYGEGAKAVQLEVAIVPLYSYHLTVLNQECENLLITHGNGSFPPLHELNSGGTGRYLPPIGPIELKYSPHIANGEHSPSKAMEAAQENLQKTLRDNHYAFDSRWEQGFNILISQVVTFRDHDASEFDAPSHAVVTPVFGTPDRTVHTGAEIVTGRHVSTSYMDSVIVKSYPITLDIDNAGINAPHSQHGYWHLSASLDYSFVVGGTYELILHSALPTAQTARELQLCTMNTDVTSVDSACVGSVRSNKNQISIRTSVGPGKYLLSIIYIQDNPIHVSNLITKSPDSDSTAHATCSRFAFALHIDFVPVTDAETRHDSSCDADGLPNLLNGPGLIDADGYMNFLERVRFDTDSLDQEMQFHVSQPSLFRLVLSHPRLRFSASLFEHEEEKLHEWKISHMEHPTIDANSGVFQVASRDQGVFAYLMPDNYTLILTLSETVLPERGFCALVSVAMAVAPFGVESPLYRGRRDQCKAPVLADHLPMWQAVASSTTLSVDSKGEPKRADVLIPDLKFPPLQLYDEKPVAFTLKLDPSYTLNTSHDDWDILPFTVPQFTSPSFDPQAAHLPLTPQHVIAVKTNPARIIFRHAGHLKLTMSLYGAEDHERNYRYAMVRLGSKGFPPLEHTINGNPVPPHVTDHEFFTYTDASHEAAKLTMDIHVKKNDYIVFGTVPSHYRFTHGDSFQLSNVQIEFAPEPFRLLPPYEFAPVPPPVYRFPWTTDPEHSFATYPLLLQVPSQITVEINYEFLYGDLNVLVERQPTEAAEPSSETSSEDDTQSPKTSWITRFYDKRQSLHRKVLKATLPAGRFMLSLLTGPSQNEARFLHTRTKDLQKVLVRGCGFYTFKMEITPRVKPTLIDTFTCAYPALPSDLFDDIGEYWDIQTARPLSSFTFADDAHPSAMMIDHIHKLHRTRRLGVPPLKSSFGKHVGVANTTIKIPFSAILRLQAYHPEDADIVQMELWSETDSANPSAKSTALSPVVSTLVMFLHAGTKYTLSIKYGVPNSGVRRREVCMFYDLESALVPASQEFMYSLAIGVPDKVLHSNPKCSPPPKMMPFPVPAYYKYAATFRHPGNLQEGCDVLHLISFVVVEKLAEFRASLRYDFATMGISLRLIRMGLTHNYKAYRSKIVHPAVPSYNKQEIKAVLLAPGAYYLEIFQFRNDATPLKDKDRNTPAFQYDIEANWYEKDVAQAPLHHDACVGSGFPLCPYEPHSPSSESGIAPFSPQDEQMRKDALSSVFAPKKDAKSDAEQKVIGEPQLAPPLGLPGPSSASTVTSTHEFVPFLGEAPIHLTRYLVVRKTHSQHILAVTITEPSFFRIYIGQERFPIIHTKIHVSKVGDPKPKIKIDAEARGAELMTYAEKFGLSRGMAGRLASKGTYYFNVSYSGHVLGSPHWAFKRRRFSECEHVLHLELVIQPVLGRTPLDSVFSTLEHCGLWQTNKEGDEDNNGQVVMADNVHHLKALSSPQQIKLVMGDTSDSNQSPDAPLSALEAPSVVIEDTIDVDQKYAEKQKKKKQKKRGSKKKKNRRVAAALAQSAPQLSVPLSTTLSFPRYAHYHQQFSFEVTDMGALLSLDIEYDFLTGTLDAYVEGPLRSPYFAVHHAKRAEGRIYMSNVTLSKGPYLIHIKDPFEVLHPVVEKLMKTQHETGFSFRQAASSGELLCQQYAITLQLIPQRFISEHLVPIPGRLLKTVSSHPASKVAREYAEVDDALVNSESPDTLGDIDEDDSSGMDDLAKVSEDGANDMSGVPFNMRMSRMDDAGRCKLVGQPLPMFVDEVHYGVTEPDGSPVKGRIHFSGDHFISLGMSVDSSGAPSGDSIGFSVHEPSVLRVFGQTRAAGYDLDMILYSSGNDDATGNIVAISDDHALTSGSVRERSLRAYLNPQAVPYMLRIKHAVITSDDNDASKDPETICGEFSLLFVLEPTTRVEKFLHCPEDNEEGNAAQALGSGLSAFTKEVQNRNPPLEYVVKDDGLESFQSHMFDSETIKKSLNASSDDPNLFRYRIRFIVGGEDEATRTKNWQNNVLTRFQAVLGYNFLIGDFLLVLRRGDAHPSDDEAVLVRGFASPLYNRDGDLSFASALEGTLLPGVYYLDIEEETQTNPHFTAGELVNLYSGRKQCFPFVLGIEAYLEHGPNAPFIESVEPMGGLNLDPLWDLEVVLTFSVPARLAPTTMNSATRDNGFGLSHFHDISTAGAVWLTPLETASSGPHLPGSKPVSVMPMLLRFSPSDPRRLVAVFDHQHFCNDCSFKLEVDATKFADKAGVTFSNFQPFAKRHIYHFGSTHNRLHPHAANVQPPAQPTPREFALGPSLGLGVEITETVTHCGPGYHLAGRKCAPDTKCSNSTCNGHGLCDDSNGYPKCLCFPGFITVGDNFCSACENLHQTYPKCTQDENKKDEFEMNGRCSTAIFPIHLNSPGLLSPQEVVNEDVDGGPSLHMCDWYHINVETGIHITYFELHVTSVFRIYVLSDEGVKVGLYPAIQGAPLLHSGSTYMPREGGIYTLLPAAAYHLALVFDQDLYFSNTMRNPCPSMHIELAIEPLARINALPQSTYYHTQHPITPQEKARRRAESGESSDIGPGKVTFDDNDHGISLDWGICSPSDRRPLITNQHPQAPFELKYDHVPPSDAAHPMDSETHKVVSHEEYAAIPHTGFIYKNRGAHHTVNARATSLSDASSSSSTSQTPEVDHQVTANRGRTAFEFAFRIPDYLHHQAYIKAVVSYDFIIGQMRMDLNHQMEGGQSMDLWQQGHGTMGASVLSWMSTKFGDVTVNQNHLRVPLPPGNYTLSVFEPLAQNPAITRCAPYDVSIEIGFLRVPHAYQKKRNEKFRRFSDLDVKDDTGAPLGMEEQYRGEMDEMETEFALSKQMTAESFPNFTTPIAKGAKASDRLHPDAPVGAVIDVDSSSTEGTTSEMPFMDQLDAAMNGEPEATSEVVTAPPAPVEEFSNPESITGNGSSSSSHPTPTQKYEMPTRSVGHATQLTSTQEHLSRSAVVPLAEEFLDAECKLRPIPTSLNVPGLLGATGSHLHFYDRFRYDPSGHTHDIYFNVTQFDSTRIYDRQYAFKQSLLKVYIPFHMTKLHVRMSLILLASTEKHGKHVVEHYILGQADNAVQDQLSGRLYSGSYVLRLAFDIHFDDYGADDGTREQDSVGAQAERMSRLACEGFVMELALTPLPTVSNYSASHDFGPEFNIQAPHLPNLPDCPLPPFVYRNPPLPPPQGKTEEWKQSRRYRPIPFLAWREYVREHRNREVNGTEEAVPTEEWKPVDQGEEANPIVAEYYLEIRNAGTIMEVELESDFISGQMGLSIKRTGAVGEAQGESLAPSINPPVIYGLQTGMNVQTLRTELAIGTYALVIRLLTDYRDLDLNTGHEKENKQYVPFEFDFRMRLLPHRDEVYVCLQNGYELLPSSLNSVRFLGTETARPSNYMRKGSAHFFGQFLLPSIHMHERVNRSRGMSTTIPLAVDVDHPHLYNDVMEPLHAYSTDFNVDRMQFKVTSLSLMRLSFSTEPGNSIRMRLVEYPCIAENVHVWHRYLNMNLQCKPQVLVDTTDYQFDILRFVYNGLYELEIREMESSASHAHKGCAAYSLEFALEPMAAFNALHGSVFCPGTHGFGSDHFPPPPPAVITHPYHYDSNARGESLYIQQRSGHARTENYFFTVPTPFRFYAELGYDFLRGDLTMDLMLSESQAVNIHTGEEHYNRHTIALDYMPPGRYVFTIREPNDGDMGWFCTTFSLVMQVYPIHLQMGAHINFGPGGRTVAVYEDPLALLSPIQRAIPPYPRLPKTLDSVAFLGLRSEVHLFGTYSLIHSTPVKSHTHAHNSESQTSPTSPEEAPMVVIVPNEDDEEHEDLIVSGGLTAVHRRSNAQQRANDARALLSLSHTAELTNAMQFTVRKPSVLRVFAAPHRESATFFTEMSLISHAKQTPSSSPYHHEEVYKGATSSSASLNQVKTRIHTETKHGKKTRHKYAWLLATLAPGVYSLVIQANRTGIDVPHASRWFDWDQTYLADVEFALHPLYDWEKHTAESGKEEGGGAITTLPEEAHIHLTPSQSVYHFSSPRMRLCTPGQTGVTKRRKQVHSVPFTVDEESIAFVEVHYDFLENHLLLSLEGKEHRTGMLRSLHGSPRKNSNHLYVSLRPGDYRIVIHSFGVLPALTKDKIRISGEGIDGCSRYYSLAIFIHGVKAALATDHNGAPLVPLPKTDTNNNNNNNNHNNNNMMSIPAQQLEPAEVPAQEEVNCPEEMAVPTVMTVVRKDLLSEQAELSESAQAQEDVQKLLKLPATQGVYTQRNFVFFYNGGPDGFTEGVYTQRNFVFFYNGGPDGLTADSTVRVYGEAFTFPPPLEIKWQWIKVPVLVDTIFRVDVRSSSPHSNLRLVLFKSSNNTVTPIHEANEERKISQVYRLAPSEMVYFLGVGTLAATVDRSRCPSFALDIAQTPEATLRSALRPFSAQTVQLPTPDHHTCPVRLPSSLISVSQKGYARQRMKLASLHGVHSGSLSYPIHFKVTLDSHISATVYYNFLSAAFSLVLERIPPAPTHGLFPIFMRTHPQNNRTSTTLSGPSHVVFRSRDESAIPEAKKALQNEGGQIFETNEYNVAETYDFRTSLRGYIIPGDYVLTLHEHLSGPYTALLEKEELACRVFGWDLTITPADVGSSQAVDDSPPTRDENEGAAPVDTTSSSPTTTNAPVTFVSTPVQTASSPSSADQKPAETHIQIDAQTHTESAPRVTEAPKGLQCMNGGRLVEAGRAQVCNCLTGYTGPTCTECDVGFRRTAAEKCEYIRKRPRDRTAPPTSCNLISCGCFNIDLYGEIDASHPPNWDACLPIGQCHVDAEGKAHCGCPEKYTGARCESCAPGYSDYPKCTPRRNAQKVAAADTHADDVRICGHSCGKGVCIPLAKQCKCPENYGGQFCEIELPSNSRNLDAALTIAAKGASLYVVYSATIIACIIVILGLLLHYRQRKSLRHARGSQSSGYFRDDGL